MSTDLLLDIQNAEIAMNNGDYIRAESNLLSALRILENQGTK